MAKSFKITFVLFHEMTILESSVQIRLVIFRRYKFLIRQGLIIYSPGDYIGFGLLSFTTNKYNVVFRTIYYKSLPNKEFVPAG